MRASASVRPMRPGTGFFGFNTVKYEPTPAPAISATTTTAIAMRRPQRFFGRTTCSVTSSEDNVRSVSASIAMGPVSSPPMVSGIPDGLVASVLTTESTMGLVGPVASLPPNFGVVRITSGSSGATFCIGGCDSMSGRRAGAEGSDAMTSSSNNPVPTTSIGVGRGMFSAACTKA